MIDLAALRVRTLGGNPHRFERRGIGDRDMSVYAHKDRRMIPGLRINILAAGKPLIGPFRVVPALPHQPFSGSSGFRAGRYALLHLLQGFGSNQVCVEFFKSAGRKMGVSIVESRHNKVAAQINHLGLGAFELLYFLIRARSNDLARGHCNSLDPGCSARIDIAIDKHDFRRSFLLSRERTSQGEYREYNQQHFHSCTPVRAKRARRIRLSPRSRLVQSNHSRMVWAPPPSPPEPMVMASRPSESGMLASVEAKRGMDWILR